MHKLRSWLVLFLLAFSLVARAESESSRKAKQHWEQGMAHYHLEEWDPAIAEFEAGFRVRAQPEFLYNIAQAYRLSKRPEQAASFYRKYLRVAPNAANRAEVEAHIVALSTEAERQRAAAATPPPPTPVEAPPPTVVAPAPTPSPATQTLTAAPPPPRPLYKKAWFWGAIGGGVAVVATAVALGVVFGTRGNSIDTLPKVSF